VSLFPQPLTPQAQRIYSPVIHENNNESTEFHEKEMHTESNTESNTANTESHTANMSETAMKVSNMG
jgi:hypothetical protein